MGDDGVLLISARGEILPVDHRLRASTGYAPAELVGARGQRTVLCALGEADAGTARRRAHGDLADEQAALRRVATAVAREAERDEIFALVAREVAELLGAGAGGVARFADEEHAVLVGAWTTVDALRVPLGTTYRSAGTP